MCVLCHFFSIQPNLFRGCFLNDAAAYVFVEENHSGRLGKDSQTCVPLLIVLRTKT